MITVSLNLRRLRLQITVQVRVRQLRVGLREVIRPKKVSVLAAPLSI